jgi:protein SCO1/2
MTQRGESGKVGQWESRKVRSHSRGMFLQNRRRNSLLNTLILLFFASVVCRGAQTQPLSDSALAKIVFEQRLNQQLSLNLEFQNEENKSVKLRDYFTRKPVILVLGYYECPMLCTLGLNGLVESLQDMKWSIGKEFDVLCASISPSENSALAAAKKRTYLRRYGRAGAAQGWHFLTGAEPAVREIADEVGFHYAYDPVFKQYAHPSGFVVLTPEGKVARYFFGVSHSPQEIYVALREASANRIGSPIQQLFFLCFHYNPIKGKYGGIIMLITRICAAAMVLGVAWMIVGMARRERIASPQGGVLLWPPGTKTESQPVSAPGK